MHNTTRYGELESDQERRNSLGVVFRNWHPGPLGFQVVSDSFGWWYGHSLLRALDMLQDAQKAGKSLKKEWPAKPSKLRSVDLPPPEKCDPTVCSNEFPPGCHYFAKPAHGTAQISVIPPDSDNNPIKKWHNASSDLGWSLWLAGDSPLIPDREKNLPQCQHEDKCGALEPNNLEPLNAGWLTFGLPGEIMLGRLIVCFCCGKDAAKPFVEDPDLLTAVFGSRFTKKLHCVRHFYLSNTNVVFS